MKAKHLLNEPVLQRGCRTVPLRLLQDVIGCAQCWTVVCPELIPHLPSRFTQGQLAMSRSQKGASKDVIYLLVEGSNEAEVGRKWEEFWGSLGFVRLQLEVLFQTNFGATFEKLLPVRERLAAPGQVGKSRITGGDATLSRIGAVDWTSKVLIAQEAGRYKDALGQLASEELPMWY